MNQLVIPKMKVNIKDGTWERLLSAHRVNRHPVDSCTKSHVKFPISPLMLLGWQRAVPLLMITAVDLIYLTSCGILLQTNRRKFCSRLKNIGTVIDKSKSPLLRGFSQAARTGDSL